MGGHRVYPGMRAITAVFGALVTLLVAGCAKSGADQAGAPDTAFEQRAAQVAAAWRAGNTLAEWRKGFVPLQNLTVDPSDGRFEEDTKMAYASGWFRLAMTIPANAPAKGKIRFSDGELEVPLVGAQAAYTELDQGDAPPCTPTAPKTQVPPPAGQPDDGSTSHQAPCAPTLDVTGAKLGEIELLTSRGVATVPAWLFEVAGINGVVARVAVDPSAITSEPKTPSLEPAKGVNVADLVSIEGTKITYNLIVGACDYDIKALFKEEDDLVVVGGSLKTKDGACIDLAKIEPVTITLTEPLGDRPLINATDGHPLTKH
jgi:hypothetical protein